MMQAGGGGGRLPAEYQEVEYLYTNGSNFITLALPIPTPNISIRVMKTNTTTSDQGCVGYNNVAELYFSGGKIYAWSRISLVSPTQGTAVPNNTIIDISAILTYTSSNPQYLNIGQYTKNAYIFYGNIYRAILTDGQGTEIFNLIPCYRKADNEPGMYDIVNNAFYTNAGSGTFIVGGDV